MNPAIPAGSDANQKYEEYAFPGLCARDALVIGTDGVWETCNRAGELFGKERLQETICEHHGKPAAAMAQAIENSLAAFRGSVAQQDDVTFVVVRPK